jgi:hypothetical protein
MDEATKTLNNFLKDNSFQDIIDCINYAIFYIAATSDENFNEDQRIRQVFLLRQLSELFNALNKQRNDGRLI